MLNRVKTPTVLQMEATECGAAALGIILGYYGRVVSLAQLRQECGVSRDGSKASNILTVAKRYGMQATGYSLSLAKVLQLPPPFIVFWEFNHFLVVEGFGRERVFLNDPATGPRRVSMPEFSESYTGVVLAIAPGPEFQKGGRQPSTILALRSRLQGSGAALLYCILAGFLLVIPGLVVPVFSQIFVDNVLVENRSDWLRPLILGMSLTAVLQGLLTLMQLRSLRQLKIKLSVGMSSRFLWHILRLPVQFYAQRFAGEISDRLQLNDKVAEVLSGQLATTAINAVMVIFYALVMFSYDVILTAIGIFFAGMNIFMLQWVARHRVDGYRRLTYDRGKVAGLSIAGIEAIETLKASATESDFFARWSGYFAKAINGQQTLEVTNQALGVLPPLLTALTSTLILVVGGLRVMDGALSIGMLVAFQSLMDSFQKPVSELVSFASILQELDGDLNRLGDVLHNPIDQQLEREQGKPKAKSQKPKAKIQNHPPPHTPSPTPRLQGHLALHNITFGYSRVHEPLIENFNLTLRPSQRVALVGESGSGKSTLAKLVAGLYQPWSGEISFDGVPKDQIPHSVLMNSLSMVEQEIFLFAGTVRDNLTLWNPTVPMSQLVQACEDAAIHERIVALPGGYEAQLKERAEILSGGERQRLEIARALVLDPAILVMDEATSALDAETERMIDQNLRRRGCACLIVAHRLSTIRDCDEIIVLEQGQVSQRGTHEELQREGGVYRKMIEEDFC